MHGSPAMSDWSTRHWNFWSIGPGNLLLLGQYVPFWLLHFSFLGCIRAGSAGRLVLYWTYQSPWPYMPWLFSTTCLLKSWHLTSLLQSSCVSKGLSSSLSGRYNISYLTWMARLINSSLFLKALYNFAWAILLIAYRQLTAWCGLDSTRLAWLRMKLHFSLILWFSRLYVWPPCVHFRAIIPILETPHLQF